MPKNIGFLICLLIMALDITAGILGIEAEVAQNKACLSNFKLKLLFQHFDNNNPELFRQQVKHLRLWIFECREPSHKAFNLGLAAAVLLALAHVIANLLGGCVCFWSREDMAKASANRQLAVFSLIFAWITLAVGFSLLIIGTMANSKSRKSCGISHHRFFSVGGIICFIHGLFTVAYYVSATASDREEKLARQGGHA
ncbi:hypothetical protein CICLE_v10018256mg [Citrus x clementina]|uniref:Uncharacterized protein n=1 Tax=Citrus clementina TaxID=85681 RepID=V4UJ89_CITCL|nr:uncharacterized protein LOC18051775 isoform X1 [Citrus x clementina]ESR62381.1 hypothetical protein CICLE_v10018256mg [Citrus x clementina]